MPTDKNLLESLEREVHVWFCNPDEIKDRVILDEYQSILSNEEREKYKRFYFEKDRHSYLVSHALVRKVLSRYCDIQPQSWRFSSNQYGKPEIASDIQCPSLKFNLSHTDGLSACVVSLGNDCGVDVECTQRKSKLHAVAKRMFAQQEVDAMCADGETEMQNKFFDFWTLREAYVKAIGTGLGGSSKEFYFTVDEKCVAEPDVTESDFTEAGITESGNTKHDVNRTASINFLSAEKDQAHAWQFLLKKPSAVHVASIAVKYESMGTGSKETGSIKNKLIKKVLSRKIQP